LGSFRPARGLCPVGVAALAAGLLTACGSPQASSSAVQSTCREVSAVLSDGPTSGADPVGYAEAQVLPLRQIHTSDKTLQEAIDDLATAYQRFYEAKGAGGWLGQP
jgi:hypothetical protein